MRQILGRRFDIKATIGHIKDIPSKSLGVEIEDNFQMSFVTIKGKTKVINEIKKAAQKADHVYLATDPDREGEAISWHVSQLVPAAKSVERISFNAITRSEIEKALQHPTKIDQKLVDSQFARRIIDRLIGYLLSPEASRHFGEKYSVGRVQSPALALVVEREREIRAFTPEPYWIIRVTYRKDDAEFVALLKEGRITDGERAGQVADAIRSASIHTVTEITSSESKKNPPPPFITSTFQRAAFKALRMRSKRAMRIAQDLYEGMEISGKHVALITYMRTDSPRLSAEGLEAAKEQILVQFGSKYYKRRNFRSRGSSQDAHEAIRPAHPEITPEMAKPYLESAHYRVYDLIYKRWLASQMQPALYNKVKVSIMADDTPLEATGSTLIFEGFLRVYGRKLNEQETEEDKGNITLPELEEGESLNFVSLENEEKMTQPPPRYNNGSLVEKLEKLGIGRPSTYASIIELIQEREYVEEIPRKREFQPTPRGEKLFDYLKESRPIVIDYEFTARMERELDEVEEGKKKYLEVVNDEFEKVKDAYEMYKKGGGFAMERKPTAKQIGLAKRLAEAIGSEIPAEAMKDSKELSNWIDEVKERADLPSLPPSEKQLKYAEALARDTDMELTDEMRSDAQKISKFIEQARKILNRKVAANRREFTIYYLDEGMEHEVDKIQVIDVIDEEEKKAVGLRLSLRQTKWIPRSQIVRLTDQLLCLKNKWAAENVYANNVKYGGRKGRKKTTKRGKK
jgi:DNA topoisomerase-1